MTVLVPVARLDRARVETRRQVCARIVNYAAPVPPMVTAMQVLMLNKNDLDKLIVGTRCFREYPYIQQAFQFIVLIR